MTQTLLVKISLGGMKTKSQRWKRGYISRNMAPMHNKILQVKGGVVGGDEDGRRGEGAEVGADERHVALDGQLVPLLVGPSQVHAQHARARRQAVDVGSGRGVATPCASYATPCKRSSGAERKPSADQAGGSGKAVAIRRTPRAGKPLQSAVRGAPAALTRRGRSSTASNYV